MAIWIFVIGCLLVGIVKSDETRGLVLDELVAPSQDLRPMLHLDKLDVDGISDDRVAHMRKLKNKEDLDEAKSLDKVLKLLLSRYVLHDAPTEGAMSKGRIAEICGQTATMQCGKIALRTIEGGLNALHAKCDARKEFLYCIEDARGDCKNKILKEGRYPVLPSPEIISAFQRLVKNSLWTGGGCILAY